MDFEEMIGKTMLVGLTYLNAQEEETGQEQIYGTIVRIEDEEAIIIQQENGEEFAVPADMEAIEPGEPGEYKLNSTGEIVIDPDYIGLWTVFDEEEEE